MFVVHNLAYHHTCCNCSFHNHKIQLIKWDNSVNMNINVINLIKVLIKIFVLMKLRRAKSHREKVKNS